MNQSRIAITFRRPSFFAFLCALLIIVFTACRQKADDPTGVWRAFVKNNSGEEVAFTLEIKREGDAIIGSLVNGDDRTTSTSGSFDGKTLRLRYDFYDGELIAEIDGDQLRGEFTRQRRRSILKRELRARRGDTSTTSLSSGGNSGRSGADISGEWVMRVGEAPKQSFWRAAFKQEGSLLRGTIIPVSGDWGELTGVFENNQLTLNRFDGINSRIFKATLTPQGTLEGFVDLGGSEPKRKVVAERLTANNRQIVAALPDPNNYTRMSNPAEPFRFSFPDLEGRVVSSSDERFKNKVVIVTISGSWCPNCHDESPVLQEFYDRYHARGLEVVALSFEYTGNAARDMEQIRIFARRHGIKFPMLYAGVTDEAEKKLSQLVNFGAYPTTIYIGRDGLVKHIHAGFEGKATGERFTRLKTEMEELIKKLLSATDA
jgi:peroxiredoxin